MYTIYDYLEYYKNVTIDRVEWNEIDNLLCSILAYMPNEPFNDTCKLAEVCSIINKTKLENDTWLMAPKVKKIAKIIANSKRYQDLKISNFVRVVDENVQFGAIILRINNLTIVSFEGSDGTVISWKENLRLSYKYPIESQVMALEYLYKYLTNDDKKIYLVGHSKGGNLAMSACLEANDDLYNRIIHVYNFDGPGFLPEIVESPRFNRLSQKLSNIIPKGSYIGVMLENNSKYHIVPTNETGFLVHYPTSWEVFGTTFPKTDMSKRSKYIYNVTTLGSKDIKRNEMEGIVEAIFKDNFNSFDAKMRMNVRQVRKAFENAKAEDIRTLGIFKHFIAILTIEPLMNMRKKKNSSKNKLNNK